MLARYAPYWLWGILALFPAYWTYETLASTNERILHILVHPTGEWAARLLILTLAITRWLRRNRRYFGVAAFAYAVMHTAFYLADNASLDRVIAELPRLYIWTGWLAFAISFRSPPRR